MPKLSVAVVAGAQLADYHFGEQHVFGPHRQQAFLDGMDRMGLATKVVWLDPVSCDIQSLQTFHDDNLINMVRQYSESGIGFLDGGDTPARKGIFEAAITVVGSVLNVVDGIMGGQFQRGFVPIAGLHHAYRERSSGFCVFNDCAIAIEHLRQKHHVQKILYVDMDAHHGDGVFYSYETDSRLFIVDFHEDGRYLYPGSGDIDETGLGSARGTKLNFPMPLRAGDKEFA